jgi:type VI secretion system protein ImpE
MFCVDRKNLEAGYMLEIKGVSLEQAIARVKAKPQDSLARTGLFRMFSLTGQWDRAATQLETASQLDPALALYARAFEGCLLCEKLRQQVFQGKNSPVFLGEPEQWLALLLQSLKTEQPAAKSELIEQAFASAVCPSGIIDGKAFEWIADADSRIGPTLELFIDEKYFWVPFSNIESISFNPPDDLIDTVWHSAEVTFTNGGSKSGYIPVRYSGSEASQDESLILGRSTQWSPIASGYDFSTGLGQRCFVTDQSEYDFLQIGSIKFFNED